MLEVSRAVLRRFRAVVRQCLSTAGSRQPWPNLLLQAGPHGLTLQAQTTEVAILYQQSGTFPDSTLAFSTHALAELESRKEAPVVLEPRSTGKARAQWSEAGLPQSAELELVEPATLPKLPESPAQLTAMRTSFRSALAEAQRTAAKQSTRFSLSRLQLQGQAGQLVGTDGKQLLVQSGFAFPWSEEVLVPALGVFASRELDGEEPVAIGRTATHVALRLGCWTLLLRIDTTGRFPDIRGVVPGRAQIACHVTFDPEDAVRLLQMLPKLPCPDQEEQPITLALAEGKVVVRASAGKDEPTEEVKLPCSTSQGKPLLLCLNRQYLARALELGCREWHIAAASKPVVCKARERLYLVMPLTPEEAVRAEPAVATSGRTVPRSTDLSPVPRRNALMPIPERPGAAPNGHAEESTPASLDLFAEAEELRAVLQDASARAGRLLLALKQQRRQHRAVVAAMQTLRQLPSFER